MGKDPLAAVSSGLTRRSLLRGAAAATLAGCARDEKAALQGGWVGASHERGHRWRDAAAISTTDGPLRRASVLVIGGGIAGLAAARGFMRRGVDDVHLLELEDEVGGNSRGHAIAGIACPLGAHYLPQPGEPAREVAEWLHEIGVLKSEHGRTVADERHLCHSPQERLFFEGAWYDGLLPPAERTSSTQAQYQRFAQRVASAGRFAIPSVRAGWSDELAALDGQTFAAWLARHDLDDAKLRWYLDYCCGDDYGAGIDTVSAWAGLHYFASRHGFHAPGDGDGEREPVLTWPEGNAWLVNQLAAPLGKGRIHGARIALRVSEQRGHVDVIARHGERNERWQAGTVVLALPLFIAARLLDSPPDALREAASFTRYAPWLVANLHLDAPLVDRPGAPPAWDNVGYGGGLGYVDAMHQSLRPYAGATVLTSYAALPVPERAKLLAEPWAYWADRVLGELSALHPDLRLRVRRVDLMRYGHAMAVPLPGLHAPALRAAREALRGGSGRIRFAHADLAGYSIFEEAFTAGEQAAAAPCRCG